MLVITVKVLAETRFMGKRVKATAHSLIFPEGKASATVAWDYTQGFSVNAQYAAIKALKLFRDAFDIQPSVDIKIQDLSMGYMDGQMVFVQTNSKATIEEQS